MINEGLLQRMQRPVLSRAPRSWSPCALLHDGKCQARVDPPSVDQHRTGTALAVIAAFFGAGKVEMFSQGSSNVVQGATSSLVSVPLTIRSTEIFSGARTVAGSAVLVRAICILRISKKDRH